MNREIKFRAWDKNHMVYNPELYSNNCVEKAQKAGVVLMQYTGLKDKNGKEIYERDLVRLIESPPILGDEQADYVALNYVGSIEWDNEGADYNIVGKEELRGLGNGKQILEVIGNIYENPEFL